MAEPVDLKGDVRGQLTSMLGLAAEFKGPHEKKEPIKLPPHMTNMLTFFEDFAPQYLDFVVEHGNAGFPDYDYQLNRAVRRILAEWETISRACEQHSLEHFADELNEVAGSIESCYEAFLGYKSAAKPVAYFEKLYAITRFVFTPYPLISIPLVYFGTSMKRMALAHEMGHYFYWNSCGLHEYRNIHNRLYGLVDASLTKSEAGRQEAHRNFLTDRWQHWLEETFADICGALLEGFEYGHASIDRTRAETGLNIYRLLEDDGEHPVYFVRPQICIETLAWIAERETNTADKAKLDEKVRILRKRWENNLVDVKIEAEDMLEIFGELASEFDIAKALSDTVRTVVRTILGADGSQSWVKPDLLRRIGFTKDNITKETWSVYAPTYAPLGSLFHYQRWYESSDLTPTPLEKSVRGASLENSVYRFENLLASFSYRKGENEAEVVQALLELGLSEKDFETPTCRKVVKDGMVDNVQAYKLDDKGTLRKVKTSTVAGKYVLAGNQVCP